MKNLAEISWKRYFWKARDEEKRMVWFVSQFGLSFLDMQKRCWEENKSSLSWFNYCRNKMEKKEFNVSCLYIGLSCGPNWPLRLQGFKTPICGSRMRSTNKRKVIVEKSSFQKVYFPYDFQISKFMHRFGIKWQIFPFPRKMRFLGFEFKRSKHKSCRVKHKKSKKVEINIFRNQW